MIANRTLLLCILLSYAFNAVYAYEESFHSLPTREDAQQPFWLIEPENPVSSVILFAGGGGKLKIDRNGIGKTGNFLVRTREQFADAGFTVAVVDKPTDRRDMFSFRTTQKHARDIHAIIKFLNKRTTKPVWLVGTSRGTISVANVASRIDDKALKGIVLTSSVLRPSKDGKDSLHDVSVKSIKEAALFVHHKGDGCYVCLYDDVPDIMKMFNQTRKIELKSFTGGNEKQSNPCKAKTYHGFLGIEKKVVGAISNWIKSN